MNAQLSNILKSFPVVLVTGIECCIHYSNFMTNQGHYRYSKSIDDIRIK